MKKIKKYIVVDLTDVKDATDVYAAFADAKIRNKEAITMVEYHAIIDSVMRVASFIAALTSAVSTLTDTIFAQTNKKPNIFKRALNKIKSWFKK
jgi:hypothetical protein